MPRFDQILPIFGPMNDTVDKERLQTDEGVVLKRTNMRPDRVGDMYANLPVKGTVEIDYPEQHPLPDGLNKTLGWCVDFKNEAIVWMVWNSNGNHCVYRYYKLTDQIEAIVHPTTNPALYDKMSRQLGLSQNTVVNCKVIDGRLYWNDDSDRPKAFNIQKAIDYTNLAATGYTAADEPFDLIIYPYIKNPPRYAPTVGYSSDTVDEDGQVINFNNIRKKQWQFKYTYVYEDFQESAYSPISVSPLPQEDVDAFGVWAEPITQNNTIVVGINTGSNNVKTIKIAVRDASNLNTGPFYLFEVIEKFDVDGSPLVNNDINLDIKFRNNTQLTNIDTERENTYFHNVPLKARDLILLDNKYVSMSMPLEGYDYKETEVDYELEEVGVGTGFDTSFINMPFTLTNEEIQDEGVVLVYDVYTVFVPADFRANSEYRIQYKWYDVVADGIYLTGDTELAGFPEYVRDSIYDQLDASNTATWIYDAIAPPVIIEKLDTDKVVIKLGYYNVENPDVDNPGYAKGLVYSPSGSPAYTGLKRGQYHPFALVYNDQFGRYNACFGDKKLYASPLVSSGIIFRNSVVKARMTINHRPPVWAHTYRIAYLPYNSYTYCIQIPQVEQIKGDGANGIPSNKYFLKINQAITRIKDGYPNSLIEAYLWQNGDRARHVDEADSYELLEEFSRIYELGDQSIIETGYLCDHEFKTGATTNKILGLEIYRPNLTPQDKNYYEIGEEFPIINPGAADRSHGGQQNQSGDLVTPAVSVLDFGDIYHRLRMSNDIDKPSLIVESNHLSDYYQSNGMSIGRPVLRTELKQSLLGRVTRSENYIENTELNRLNIFLPGAEIYDVSELDGEITRIIQKGDVLKIIQAHKETSVYIGKNYAKDGNGEDIILISDKTFGSFNKYDPYNGGTYPHAVVASEDYVYFLDLFTGDLMRSASNGTISLPKQYGMQLYFDEKCRAFRAYTGEKDVFISIEPNQESVYTTFIMGNDVETIVFSESQTNQGFMFFVEFSYLFFKPEEFAWFGDNMFSWTEGRFHIHGLGPDNSFYGSERKSGSIEVVSNMYPEAQKTFEVLSIDTDGSWSAEMTVRTTNNHPFGQYTKIFEPMFKSREGLLNSAIPRNIRDLNGADDVQRLYSGNKMSGSAMVLKASSVDFSALRELKLTLINQR